MKETKGNHILNIVCRWFVGIVFIFSGFVKGVDPLGTSFKIQEYMTAWSVGSITFEWALPFATVLSVALCTLEFTIGVMLLTNCYRRLTAWLLGLMMLFFTCTTLADAITNKVTDCGCFGDAIKLTNWQTFWKNIVLMVPTVIIFIQRRMRWNYKRHFERETLIAILSIAAMVIFGIRNINNEPCIDFRAWKVGNQMMPFGEDLKMESYLTYKDKSTGEVKEYVSAQVPYQDSVWMANHEFVDSRVVDPYEISADGFSMLGPDGEDNAKDIIGNAEYVLIATIHHIDKLNDKGIKTLKRVHHFCMENNINFMLLTSALDEEVEALLYQNGLAEVMYYFADATAIETMLRSNPGFILLKDAKVLGKWHYNNAEKIMEYPFEIE